MKSRYDPSSFTSSMTKGEYIATLFWLPMHIWLLPLLLFSLPQLREYSDATVNLIAYAIGGIYILLAAGRFLRRDFDPLCDRPFFILLQVLACYGMMLALNLLLNTVLLAALPEENPNNAAVVDMAFTEYGKTAALAIFLAPLVEEPIFRGGIFGLLRKHNRILAYLVSMLSFSIYHVWGYAAADPIYWLYLLQYLPVSWLLCRCYERCNSIWGSIFFHMMVNAISIQALMTLSKYL